MFKYFSGASECAGAGADSYADGGEYTAAGKYTDTDALPCHLIAGTTVINPQLLGLHLVEEKSAVPADPPLLRNGRLQALNTLPFGVLG